MKLTKRGDIYFYRQTIYNARSSRRSAAAFADDGKKVLLLDFDINSRSLDILTGCEDRAVFDLGDILDTDIEYLSTGRRSFGRRPPVVMTEVKVVEKLVKSDVAVYEIAYKQMTLEEYYLNSTGRNV